MRTQGDDGELTAEDKAAGLGSVFKRDDARLAAMREDDEREKVRRKQRALQVDWLALYNALNHM